MKIISSTIDYEGYPIKIQSGKVFVQQFGTTINNHSMHYSWFELKQEEMKKEFKNFLKENNLI